MRLLLLGLALVVLVGAMTMPILVYVARKFLVLVGATIRTMLRYIVSNIIETVIIALLSIFGGLWILDIFSPILR